MQVTIVVVISAASEIDHATDITWEVKVNRFANLIQSSDLQVHLKKFEYHEKVNLFQKVKLT